MIRSLIIILVSGLFLPTLFGQNIVSEEVFITAVLEFHPIARQAAFKESAGYAKLLKAKGWFDPKVNASYDQKSFDGKNYFQIANGELKVPTWIGLDVKVAYNWNNGLYINQESTIPNNGLLSAGIELPVLQGLIFDKRRADLQQGKNYAQMGQLERQQLLNKLLFDASEAYWMWYESYEKFKIAQEGVILAETTFDFVKSSVRLGDKPAIDTLEALIQIQNRKLELENARLNFKNRGLWAGAYLWFENNTPAKLQDDAKPESFRQEELDVRSYIDSIQNKMETIVSSNPKIAWYGFKVDNLEIEKRLKKELLKPQLNVSYNFLNQPFQETVFDQFNVANYKWNVNFAMPLFLRKERRDLKLVKAELEGANASFSNIQLQQEVKIEAILNKIQIYTNQLELNAKNVIDNRNLVNAEKRKFDIGESSLFLVNYRELSLLKILEKQAEIEAKVKIALAELEYQMGW